MRRTKVLLLLTLMLCVLVPISGCHAATPDPAAQNALDAYVHAPDSSFQWKSVSSSNKMDVLSLTSQTWHGSAWKHKLTIVKPDHDEFPGTALLLISFDDPSILNVLANGTGCMVIGLSDVPNQPLWDRSEDALIAYTFQQFLETGDKTWPLLLPMTKSATTAMDAVQEYSKTSDAPITKFIVGGASKRGWTTWLVAAEDKRVIGIVPMVYNNLNLPAQLPHQKEMLGDYSSQIGDYVKLDLPQQLTTPRGKGLVQIVDPYFYRDRITVPKLIIDGTNDPYWTVDSLNLFYNDLVGPKNTFYIPNAGHSMNLENGTSGPIYLLGTIQNWVRIVASGKTPRAVELDVNDAADGKHFTASLPGATAASLYVAKSATKDFRQSTW
ncbi:MAG: PhoPQ-activated protein PqaA family protein, partial [Abditibacteriaceae bacterium]